HLPDCPFHGAVISGIETAERKFHAAQECDEHLDSFKNLLKLGIGLIESLTAEQFGNIDQGRLQVCEVSVCFLDSATKHLVATHRFNPDFLNGAELNAQGVVTTKVENLVAVKVHGSDHIVCTELFRFQVRQEFPPGVKPRIDACVCSVKSQLSHNIPP